MVAFRHEAPIAPIPLLAQAPPHTYKPDPVNALSK